MKSLLFEDMPTVAWINARASRSYAFPNLPILNLHLTEQNWDRSLSKNEDRL